MSLVIKQTPKLTLHMPVDMYIQQIISVLPEPIATDSCQVIHGRFVFLLHSRVCADYIMLQLTSGKCPKIERSKCPNLKSQKPKSKKKKTIQVSNGVPGHEVDVLDARLSNVDRNIQGFCERDRLTSLNRFK